MTDEKTNDEPSGASGGYGAWTRMEKCLPAFGMEVLVAADGWIRIAYLSLNGWTMGGGRPLDTPKQPTHWMPLPWGLPLE